MSVLYLIVKETKKAFIWRESVKKMWSQIINNSFIAPLFVLYFIEN